ncbi:1-phosphatidylinositol 4-kinase [Theileria orientalis]|uniref:1-phosphatidylinositol 4-kinase n=1 Tax=Theileria orientalis TaxID=68886 RepID=A0A976QV55_THEOR|nr:1-phosphatidylinositol 4-kinase [Theileria orientalis]
MTSTKIAISYVKYRESLLNHYSESRNVHFFQQFDYALTPLVLKPEPILENVEEPLCVNNLYDPDELTVSKFMQTFKADEFNGLELVFSHLINVLFLSKLGCSVKLNVNVYKVILGYFGPMPNDRLRVSTKYKFNVKLKRNKRIFSVRRCSLSKSRRYAFSSIFKLLNSCLYIKRSVMGIKIHLKDVLKVIHYVLLYRKADREWETTEIMGSQSNYGYVSLSHLLSNILCNGNLKPDLFVSSASRWRRFDAEYFREVTVTLLIANALNLNGYAREIYSDFKSNLNNSFNENWSEHCSNNRNRLNGSLDYIRKLYAAMNEESPLRKEEPSYKFGHPIKYMPKNLMLDGRYNLEFLRYMLYVVKGLLRDGSRISILTIIEMVVHYFTHSTIKVGFLKCATPYKCLVCTSVFTEVYISLLDVLEGLRSLTYSYSHLFLVRMLIKNEIERIKTSFFGSYTDDLSNFLYDYKYQQDEKTYLERSLRKSHYPPRFSQFLRFRVISRMLKACLSWNVNIFIKENSVSTSSKCSWYLKLLMCVDMHVNKVDASSAINKSLSTSTYMHLDQLNNNPPRSGTYRPVYCGNNVLTDEMEILYNLYVNKPSIHQYLSTFTLSDELNVIQRTQACLVLSKNLNYVEAVLEQLVQCLVIDPGDRIINLLYTALDNHKIRNKILYNLACLIHSNISTATNHKINAFIKFIFVSLPDDVKSLYTNQILLHGKLLELTMNLADLPMSKRYDELSKKILEISQTINEECNLYLYEEFNSSFMGNQMNNGANVSITSAKDDASTTSTSKISTSGSGCDSIDLSGNGDRNPSNNVNGASNTSVDNSASKVSNTSDHNDTTAKVDMESDSCKSNKMECDQIVGIDVNSVKILHSATRVPFMLTYKLKSGKERTYIYKMKDDLRQDSLVIQIKRFMLGIFESHDLRVFLRPFLVIPYSSVLGEIFSNGTINEVSPRIHLPRKEFEIGGIVGFIPNTMSRHNIGKESCVSIKHYFLKRFGHELSPNYIRAVDNFITSLAGYALLSFLLQVKDRHNGNLLFTTSGHIIHIDFGFILGASPAKDLQFELAPFKFTQEMVEFMGGYNSDNFKKFIDLLINSYFALRTHSNLVLTLVQLLQYSNIPCFRKSTLIKLKRRLRLNDTPSDAKSYILRKIFYALHSKTTKLYDVVQNYQQGIEH